MCKGPGAEGEPELGESEAPPGSEEPDPHPPAPPLLTSDLLLPASQRGAAWPPGPLITSGMSQALHRCSQSLSQGVGGEDREGGVWSRGELPMERVPLWFLALA